jgi:phosphopantothenoylcysteine decarboxylase/phosphopantothenate--cysteine ligase
MHAAVLARADDAAVVVMAAAVADYAPSVRSGQKVTKDGDSLTLVLQKTPDILADLGRRRRATGRRPVLVGFAAETEDLMARASAKRERKQVDLIVANDVSRADAGFEVETNAVTFVAADGAESLPLLPKADVAAAILDRVEKLLARESGKTETYAGPRRD